MSPARANRRGRGLRWILAALAVLAVLAVLAGQRLRAGALQAAHESPQAPAITSISPPARPPEYVGSSACEPCHAEAFRRWKGAQHERAMQVARPDTVLGDFGGATFRDSGTTAVFTQRDGGYHVRTEGADGKPADFTVQYTYGVYPLQQYLIGFPDGRLQALSIAWDSRARQDGGQRWFHLYPERPPARRDALHWTGAQQNWNFMCADCHSTNLRKGYDAAANRFKTTWSEINVGCEACHGPGSRHLEWARTGGSRSGAAADDSKGLTVLLDERRGVSWTPAPNGNAVRTRPRESEREIEVCARCHAHRTQIAEGYVPGQPLQDFYRVSLLEPGLYFPDGQQQGEVFIYGSFLQSRMYQHGVTCGDCHDPHSQKTWAPGNALCAQCHSPAKYDTPSHHHHGQASAGARCVECHMPATTYMRIDPRRDHSFRIPRPDWSTQLGTPNACNGCHGDRSPEWALAQLEAWYGRPPAGLQRFGPALHAARTEEGGRSASLSALLNDTAQPAIARATAAEALQSSFDADARAAVEHALRDISPLVRLASLSALAALPLPERPARVGPMLEDPARTVRMEAARLLAPLPPEALAPPLRTAFERAAGEYEDAQRYNADRPESRLNLAVFLAQRGRVEEAEAELQGALKLAPTYAPAYVNLAELRRARGDNEAAERLLREGLRAAPEDPMLHHALGLALTRAKRNTDALAELARAAELAPDDARLGYVYGVALASMGRTREAISELERVLRRHPDDRGVLLALATYCRESGALDAARRYAERLVALAPQDAEAQALLQALGKGAQRPPGR